MEYRIIDHRLKTLTSSYLQSIYVLTNDGKEQVYGCVPNGELGISIILAGDAFINVNESWEKQPPISIYGLVKKVQLHKMSGNYLEVNIGFNPHYLQLFLKDSMSCLIERKSTDLNYLFKKDEVQRLYENIAKSKTDEEILCVAECFLEKHLLINKIDDRISEAHKLITLEGLSNVEAISSILNISSTGLRKLFRDKVGISPKDLIKINRIKKALHTRDHTEESLTGLAYKLDYYDQSHFIHDFKQAIGLTPKHYFENKDLTFDFYNFERWRYDSFASINN